MKITHSTGITSTEMISSTATACSSKIIDSEMDPPASLSPPTTASSQISGYRLIDMLIFADLLMLLSRGGCHSIHCLKVCGISEKRKFGKAFATQLHCLFI